MQERTVRTDIAPGVWIESAPSPTRPTDDDDPSIAGFAGRARRSPRGGPRAVASWAEFVERFGEPAGDALLPDAVRGFFENGGRLAYIATGGVDVRADLLRLARLDPIRILAAPDLPRLHPPGVCAGIYRDILEAASESILIADPPRTADVSRTIRWAASLSPANGSLPAAGPKPVAAYAPWLRLPGREGETPRTVPPSGHVAGTYARAAARSGVHAPPANIPLHGASGVDLRLAPGEAEALVRAGVNPVRAGRRTGVRAYGDRTVRGSPIPVERLLGEIRRNVRRRSEWAVFEPPGRSLRQTVARRISSYLRGLWREGALVGAAPSDAFFVRCTQVDPAGAAARLVCEVGVAPVWPAEFILLRVTHELEGRIPPTEGEEGNLARS